MFICEAQPATKPKASCFLISLKVRCGTKSKRLTVRKLRDCRKAHSISQTKWNKE